MDNPNSDIKDILKYSQWGKDLDAPAITRLDKFDWVVSQLSSIQEQISKMETWPIVWRLKWVIPYDVDAQVLKSQLTSLIPWLARWVYWEVGVLTDNDIRLYAQTIPNLQSTTDVNNAILAMTLKVVAWGYKKQLQTLAASWRDVSWFTGLYDNLMGQVSSLETSLWIWKNTTNQWLSGWMSRKLSPQTNYLDYLKFQEANKLKYLN